MLFMQLKHAINNMDLNNSSKIYNLEMYVIYKENRCCIGVRVQFFKGLECHLWTNFQQLFVLATPGKLLYKYKKRVT